MKIINLTPHPVNIVDRNGEPVTTIPVNGPPVRVTERTVIETAVGVGDENIPSNVVAYAGIDGLPDAQDGTLIVVPHPVAEHRATAGRNDLRITGGAVRDKNGRILGHERLDWFMPQHPPPAAELWR